MAVQPADLLAPIGELEFAMFPGIQPADIDVRLQAYIDDGVSKVADLAPADRDDAVKAWSYSRAYRARAIQLASMPMSTAIPNEISTTRSDAQRSFFDTLADKWADIFDAAFATEDTSADQFPPTGATDNIIRW